MTLTLLPKQVHVNPHRASGSVRVVGTGKRWPEAFPQHGPGRKHDRKIELEPWQREIVDRFPQEFLRGLLHYVSCNRQKRSRRRRVTLVTWKATSRRSDQGLGCW